MKAETCAICGEKKHCIREDIGGRISCDNRTDVCLSCSIGDSIRRFEEKEMTFKELRKEINETLNKKSKCLEKMI